MPKLENPFAGLSARVVLKDHNDAAVGRRGEVWVDSNGLVGNDIMGGEGVLWGRASGKYVGVGGTSLGLHRRIILQLAPCCPKTAPAAIPHNVNYIGDSG